MAMADILDLEIAPSEKDDLADVDVTIEKLKKSAKKRKGRGFVPDKLDFKSVEPFDSISDTAKDPSRASDDAQRSADGWILIVTGIHEEALEDEVYDRFCDYGNVKNLHLNLNRRTGFLKGYALIEYEHFKEAIEAKNALSGVDLLGNTIKVDWAFAKKPLRTR